MIVSAVNDYYLPLFVELLRSLRDCGTNFSFDVGLLDVGLSAQNREQLSAFGVIVKSPGIDIDYPDRIRWEESRPYFRAMTSRPFIPSYFPGYDAYMWIDADAWVQTPQALKILPAAAQDENLYIASEFDPDYAAPRGRLQREWFEAYTNCFSDSIAASMESYSMLNVGVFALSARAPHWRYWQEILAQALGSLPELSQKHFVMEQLCLNLATYRENLGLCLMPAECNWMTVLGLPVWDETQKLYVRPYSSQPISIMHLAAQIKNTIQTFNTLDGHSLQRPLTYAAFLKAREDR